MNTHEEFDALVAAYAIDALDREDRVAFEAHLVGCSECRAALADLGRVSAGLGLSVDPIEPPADLRARTLAHATRGAHAPLSFPPSSVKVRVPGTGVRLALAASLVAAAGLALYAWTLRAELGSTRAALAESAMRAESLRADLARARLDSVRLVDTVNVLRAVDVLRVDLRGSGRGASAAGQAYVSALRGLVVSAENLPPLSSGRTYQLWVIPPGEGAAPVSAAVFGPEPSGSWTLAMAWPENVTAVSVVAVTEEPAGGSVRPTTPPLLAGAVVNN